MSKLIIGSHVSFSKDKQLLGSVEETLVYGAKTFMFYTGAPQNTIRVPIEERLTNAAKTLMLENKINIDDVIVHAPYIINLANSNNFDFNIKFLKEEISRVEQLGITKIVLHPGSHVGLGLENGIKNIANELNMVIDDRCKIIICLETMAGKGTEIGKTFKELKEIIDKIKYKDKIGICMDTCHLNDAGYDLNDFEKVLNEFDDIIGLKYLKVIHINDSKNVMCSNKDRHDNIGFGTIGFANLMNIIYHKKLELIPKILETPYVNKKPPYKQELNMIESKVYNPNLFDNF